MHGAAETDVEAPSNLIHWVQLSTGFLHTRKPSSWMSFSTTSAMSSVVHWLTTPRSSSTVMMASVLLSSFHDQLTLVGTQMDRTPSASSIDVQLATSNTTMPPASEFTEQASPRFQGEGRVVAVRVLQGNHRFVDVVDVVAGRHARNEVPVQAVGSRKPTLERRVDRM